jgi:hypothetical protein
MSADTNLISLDPAIHNGRSLAGLMLHASPQFHADALKLPNIENCTVEDFDIWGGSEDCIDANRGRNLTFRHGRCHIQGDHAFTLKGGLDGYLLDDIELVGSPKEFHIDIGNWSDQQQAFSAKTRNGTLRGVRTADGSPFIIRVLNGDVPEIIDCGPYDIVQPMRPQVWLWWTFRRNKWVK